MKPHAAHPVATCLGLLGLGGLLTTSPSSEAAPVADRPTLTNRAQLVDTDSLEVEGGVRWTDGLATSPVLLKYTARGKVEPRLGFDSSGFRASATGLHLGAKAALVRSKDEGIHLAGLVRSALPVAVGDRWEGAAHLLMDLELSPSVLLCLNTGLDLVGGPGIQLYGVPLRGTLHAPLARSLDVFGEGSTTIVGGRFSDWVVDGGLRWQLTTILQLDASVGYLITADAGWVGIGATANMGRFSG